MIKKRNGIVIKCIPNKWNIVVTEKPYATINNSDHRQLKWNKPIFIPLNSNMDNQISIQFPYLRKDCGKIDKIVNVYDNQIQYYEYVMPSIVFSKGRIISKQGTITEKELNKYKIGIKKNRNDLLNKANYEKVVKIILKTIGIRIGIAIFCIIISLIFWFFLFN